MTTENTAKPPAFERMDNREPIFSPPGFFKFLRSSGIRLRTRMIALIFPWRALGISGRGWRYNLLFLLRSAATPSVACRSLAMGVFFGILPIHGFQVAVLTLLTPFLKLNWPIAFLGVNVSCAPLLPVVIAAGVAVGKIVVPIIPFPMPSTLWIHTFAKNGIEWFIGSIILAFVAAGLTYGLSYPLFRTLAKKKIPEAKH